MPDILDVWNVETFGRRLAAELRAHAPMIKSYMDADRRIYLEHERSDHRRPRPDNPFANVYYRFVETIAHRVEERTIRAWH